MSPKMDNEVLIDCYGRSFADEISVSHQGWKFDFVFNPDKKAGKTFSLAMYLDHAALGKELLKYPANRRICLLLESPISMAFQYAEEFRGRFSKIYTHRKVLLESGEPYAALYYGTSWLEGVWEDKQFHKSRLVSFLGSIDHGDEHGYSLRMDVARMCLGLENIDCYGKGICEIDSKIIGLGKYAFSIAMENVQEDFYFSEKLIDCFLTDTVPIYWGCPAISELFDQRGIILFETLDDLEAILCNLSMEQYGDMLQYVRKNRQIAVENNWHTLKGIYTRLSDALIDDMPMDDLSPIKPRGKVESSIRRLVNMHKV